MPKEQLSKNEIYEAHLKNNVKDDNSKIAQDIKNLYPKLFKNVKTDSIRRRIGELRVELGLPKPNPIPENKPVEAVVEEDRTIRNLRKVQTDYKKKYEHLLVTNEKLSSIVELHTQLDSIPEPEPIVYKPSLGKSQATVLSLLSDIHVEQRVDKLSVNGLNEYNPDVAERRVISYFTNLVKLIKKERQDVTIENLVIGMLGDMIHGFIHEEYQQTNYMTPIEASLFIYDLLVKGFNYISDNDDNLKKIVIICKVGNHSRTTDKSYTDDEAVMSYEYGIYKHLAKNFEKDERFEFKIEENYFTYYDIYDKTIRFHHGHGFRYAGGIGGLYVPLMRFVLRANEQKVAYTDALGHWHTHIHIPQALINSSIVGFTAYSSRLGFKPEPPSQQFQLIHATKGFTLNFPILLDK